jgi:hypothetical protein
VSYGTAGSTLNDELNRLANGGTYPAISAYLDQAAAARAWADRVTVPLDKTTDLVGVLNLINNRQTPKNQWLDLAGICNKIAGTAGLEPAAALREVAN